MKIGILTLPMHTNMGGILQCYALQTVLERMGHEVTVLNREYSYPSATELLKRLGSFIKCLIKVLVLRRKDVRLTNPFALTYFPSYPICDNSQMERFAHSHTHQTQPIRSSKGLWKYVHTHNLNCVIVGSDQVWRENYVPNITDYFLGFLPFGSNVKRIAYAASFGTQNNPISSTKLNKCIKLAKALDYVSMRESSGVNMMKTIFGIDAVHVLDPTLLLDEEDYKTFEKGVNTNVGLQTYIFDHSDEKNKIINYIMNKTGMSRSDFTSSEENGIFIHPPIELWLFLLNHSKFVVTDSFHGCVFSIIFKKDFIAILNEKRGADRFYSLLNMFGLKDRLVTGLDDLKSKGNILKTPINYTHVYERYERFKADSIAFLQQALKS